MPLTAIAAPQTLVRALSSLPRCHSPRARLFVSRGRAVRGAEAEAHEL